MLTVRMTGADIQVVHKRMAANMMRASVIAAERSKEVLVDEIQRDLKRKTLRPLASQGTLSRAITGKVSKDFTHNVVIGVGDMDKMTEAAPYWQLQDEGGPIVSNIVPGFFVDMGGRRIPFNAASMPSPGASTTDRFIYTGNKRRANPVEMVGGQFALAGTRPSFMYVTRSVRPKHYFDSGAMVAFDKVMKIFNSSLRRIFS